MNVLDKLKNSVPIVSVDPKYFRPTEVDLLIGDASKAKNAADAMKVSSQDLLEMGICDQIIPEPLGGAHNNYDLMAKRIKDVIINEINNLNKINSSALINQRIIKYEQIGSWE